MATKLADQCLVLEARTAGSQLASERVIEQAPHVGWFRHADKRPTSDGRRSNWFGVCFCMSIDRGWHELGRTLKLGRDAYSIAA